MYSRYLLSSSLEADMKELYEVTYFDGNAEAVIENILENADVNSAIL